MSAVKAKSIRPNDFEIEYRSFRSSVPLRKVLCDNHPDPWRIYDTGPSSVTCPIVLLPPLSSGGECYMRQLTFLSMRGYRVMAIDYPDYWNTNAFCDGLNKVFDQLDIGCVHLFGVSLGGYLAQKYAEYTYGTRKVASVILVNSFMNTSIFNRQEESSVFFAFPNMILKRLILSGYPNIPLEKSISESVDFMIKRLDELDHKTLSSRMTLNCSKSSCVTERVSHLPMTLFKVHDQWALNPLHMELMIKSYPNARIADLKTGGNYPFLSRSAEVNLHIELHMKQFDGTVYAPFSE